MPVIMFMVVDMPVVMLVVMPVVMVVVMPVVMAVMVCMRILHPIMGMGMYLFPRLQYDGLFPWLSASATVAHDILD
jgi:hypothetical protein